MDGSPLKGAHALVTGGGRGIGAAIAAVLSENGAKVTLVGRKRQPLEKQAGQLPQPARAQVCDVTEEAAVEDAFAEAGKQFGPVSILVNNAGAAESAPFLKTEPEQWRRHLEVNLMGTVLCTRQALPAMTEAGYGRVINVASTAAQTGYAYVSAYCASKHAVLGLTRSLALEYARKGVTVNAVCPGYADTDMADDSVNRIMEKTGRNREEALSALTRVNPQGRLVQPREVGMAVLGLCLPDTGAITGQAISISGGEVL